jgi:endoglucanase
MFFKGFAASALLAAQASATIYYAGVAESSGEFGVYSTSILSIMRSCREELRLLTWTKLGATSTPGTGLPGRFGVDYAFINKSAIDVYVDQNKASDS